MKTNNIFRLMTLAIAAVAFAFVTSCEGPMGPAGPAGADGADGIDGSDGSDANATCTQCHNTNTGLVVAQVDQFNNGAHSNGTYFNRSGQCAGCHNNEGFRSRAGLTGAAEWTAVGETNPLSQISCYTCHNIHTTYTLDDWGLTNNAVVATTLFGQASDTDLHEPYAFPDAGDDSNMCLQCHQSRDRGGVPTPTSTEDVAITSSHWGPHYGIQGQILFSFNTAGYEGAAAYPTEGTIKHGGRTCLNCHMGEAKDHSLAVQYSSCTQCHTDADDMVDALRTEIKTDLYALGAYLRDNYNAMEGDDIDGYHPTGAGSPYPAKVARAVWSYMTVYQDHSYGAHNPTYIRALIANSMEEIQLP